MPKTLQDDLLNGGIQGKFYTFIRTKTLFEPEDTQYFYKVLGIGNGDDPLGLVELNLELYDSFGNPTERNALHIKDDLKSGYNFKQLRHHLSDINVSEKFSHKVKSVSEPPDEDDL